MTKFCAKPTESCQNRVFRVPALTPLRRAPASLRLPSIVIGPPELIFCWTMRKAWRTDRSSDTESLREDLTILLSYLARDLKVAGWPSILPSIIDAAERDSDVALVFKKLHSNTTAPYRAVLVRAQRAGRFQPEDTGFRSFVRDRWCSFLQPLVFERAPER